MGNPLSPVVASIYMEHFEELALESAKFKPATWLHYVDDTFVIWNEGRDKLLDFLELLNSIRPSIQFRMELEVDRKLPMERLQQMFAQFCVPGMVITDNGASFTSRNSSSWR